jgi:DNA invertase Pin-like site-specific DNA recombinase
MKVFEYSRVSTNSQDLVQQQNTVRQYLANKGLSVYKTVTDEGVSGGVSYKERNLAKLLNEMSEGDILIVSEISRLGRSISDVNKLVNDELKPRKLRLIIVKMNIDLDCSNIRAIDEMILFAFSFSAQVEKEMIQQRVVSKLETIKKELEDGNSHVTQKGKNKGRVITKLGNDKWTSEGLDKARAASNKRKQDNARANKNNQFLYRFIRSYEADHGAVTRKTNLQPICDKLNFLGAKTATGLEFTPVRLRGVIFNLKVLFAES